MKPKNPVIYFYWHGEHDPRSTWETAVLDQLKGVLTDSNVKVMAHKDYILVREYLQTTYNCWVNWAGLTIGITFRDSEGYLAFKLTFL